MTLSGKITVCELEEDNPQKSFFRIKPVLTFENGAPVDASGTQAEYGDEGGIRIVPYKNDAMRFKARMRTLGGYCLMDLTAHPNENEKIRPNKNYSLQNGELNRNIVYSDVIRSCGETDVMQVFESAEAGRGQPAYTPKVLIREDGQLKGPYIPELTPDRVVYQFAADSGSEISEFDPEKLVTVRRDSAEVTLYLYDALRALGVAPAEPVVEPEPEAKESAPAEAAPEKVEPAPQVKAESAPASASRREEPARPVREDAPARAKNAGNPPSAKHEEPPRRSRREENRMDEAEAALLNDRHLKRGSLEGQTGLNPRRSKSLSEVVDYHWRQSRLEQLGAGVSEKAAASPLVSPVEKAKQAIREVWDLPEGRSALAKEFASLENAEALLSVNCPAPQPKASPDEDELNRLEAEKLELLRDIDKLNSDRIRQRGELMEETRAAHAKEISELERREQQLKDECAMHERAAQSARQAQAEAEKLLNREAKLKLDSEFLKFAMFTKAAALLRSEESIDMNEYSGVPETSEPTGAQMISDLRRAFEAGGREISHDEALNYLACLAIGSMVIFSGPTGCGKSYTAHALAGALGLRQKGAWRFTRLEADREDVTKSVGFREQMQLRDDRTQRFVLLEDINMTPVPDQSRGLLSFADEAVGQGVTILMTCLDDQIGYPLQSRLLDRAFFIRLKLPEGNAWQGAKSIPDAAVAPSLESVRRVFLTPNEVPAELKSRMELLIRRLGEIGVHITPRALSDMYQYCAAVCPLMTGERMSAFDRAVAQRALPHILATAKPAALRRLPEILCDLPISLSLLSEPIALPPI